MAQIQMKNNENFKFSGVVYGVAICCPTFGGFYAKGTLDSQNSGTLRLIRVSLSSEPQIESAPLR